MTDNYYQILHVCIHTGRDASFTQPSNQLSKINNLIFELTWFGVTDLLQLNIQVATFVSDFLTKNNIQSKAYVSGNGTNSNICVGVH